MGQRLNIEIKQGKKVLANAYYHWSGATKDSAELTNKILDSLDSVQHENPVLRAIRLFEKTNALLSHEEISFAQKMFQHEVFEGSKSRNLGLISISSAGIQSTEKCEDRRVSIDLVSETVSFNVLSVIDKSFYMRQFEQHGSYDNLPVATFNYAFDKIPFSEFADFTSKMQDFTKDTGFSFRTSKANQVVLCIK